MLHHHIEYLGTLSLQIYTFAEAALMTCGRSSKKGFEVHPPRLCYGGYVSTYDRCFVNFSWYVILAFPSQVTLRGNIDYGL